LPAVTGFSEGKSGELKAQSKVYDDPASLDAAALRHVMDEWTVALSSAVQVFNSDQPGTMHTRPLQGWDDDDYQRFRRQF
jgi:hypothetical protein